MKRIASGLTFSLSLALAFLAAPLTAAAQQAGKIPLIGLLSSGSPSAIASYADAFRQELRGLGYVEGQNIAIEYRHAEGRLDRLPILAAELVQLKVDAIVTEGTPASLAAKKVTGTIPIVIAGVGDPVGPG